MLSRGQKVEFLLFTLVETLPGHGTKPDIFIFRSPGLEVGIEHRVHHGGYRVLRPGNYAVRIQHRPSEKTADDSRLTSHVQLITLAFVKRFADGIFPKQAILIKALLPQIFRAIAIARESGIQNGDAGAGENCQRR